MANAPHMILFPFMAQGHTLPMLDLAMALARRGVKITIFTTPYNSVSIRKSLSQTQNIQLEILPFPAAQCEERQLIPPGCENTDQLPSIELLVPFVMAVKTLQQPFERSLEKMVRDPTTIQEEDRAPPPVCIISDFFLWWTQESGSKFGIPRVAFSGMGAYGAAVIMSVVLHHPHKDVKSESDPFEVPGLPTRVVLTRSELWDQIKNLDRHNPWTELLGQIGLAEQRSHGAILNTFTELEPIYAPYAQTSIYANLWCLGPTVAWSKKEEGGRAVHNTNSHAWEACMDWLDARAQRRPGSVVYLSFGTHTNVPDDQMTEIAWGLASSKWDFLLVVRSGSWRVPDGLLENTTGTADSKGLIIRDWVRQSLILSHRAVGGCFTHCGWNSILESLSCGVPLLAWAMVAEQHLNEKMVVEELGAGIRILHPIERSRLAVIGREVIRERVDELMCGELGSSARSRAVEIGVAARRAVEEGGSSYTSLNSLIQHLDELRRRRTPKHVVNAEI